MSTQEICRTVSISEDNLWVMLHRARMALRESLERNWFENQSIKSFVGKASIGAPTISGLFRAKVHDEEIIWLR
jgi:hypothetical protein